MAEDKGAAAGFAAGIAAFAIWGAYPLYFKAAAAAGAAEVLAHRIVWSLLFVALVITAARRWGAVRAAVQNRARLRRLAYSSVWVSINWGIFIWAIAQGETLQSSLGYYIAPLVNIALGVVFLGERLAAAQWAAVALAACGVVWLAAAQGVVPWIALSLAVTFGFYALTRKRADVDGLSGLCVETAILAPLALGWIIWLGVSGDAAFLHHSRNLDILLLAAGVVTAVPFILFAEAARRLPLSTIGLLQYLTPTGHLLVAVFAFGEDFTFDHAVTFAFIWTALAVYSASMGRQARRGAA